MNYEVCDAERVKEKTTAVVMQNNNKENIINNTVKHYLKHAAHDTI